MRYRTLHAMQSALAVVETTASSLVHDDDDDQLTRLDQLVAICTGVVELTSSPGEASHGIDGIRYGERLTTYNDTNRKRQVMRTGPGTLPGTSKTFTQFHVEVFHACKLLHRSKRVANVPKTPENKV